MRATIAAVTVAAALACPASSQILFQGDEFQVNSFTLSAQYGPAVAGSTSGFIVVWAGAGASDNEGITGRRFSSAGAPLGADFQANAYTTHIQTYPSVAADETGFVVAWLSVDRDGDGAGVFARRFASTGTPIATEFQVNTRTTGDQRRPSVAMSGGGFVVVWESQGDYYLRGIFGQRFASTGARLGEEFGVNSHVQGDQSTPAVAMDAQEFVVVWRHDGDDGGIFGRQFDNGFPTSEDFQVSAATVGNQLRPSVAKDGSGYVVVWDGYDGDSGGVFARRYDSGGAAQASEFRVNSALSGIQLGSAVAIRNGSFVVAWNDFPYTTLTIRARGFDGAGSSPLGDPQVNVYSNNEQRRPSVARSGQGFVVVWDSRLQDGSGYGVFGRRLLMSADLDVDGNGAVDPLTDTLLALRYAFGFRGATLITGAVAGNCTRCDAPSIEAYLAGLM